MTKPTNSTSTALLRQDRARASALTVRGITIYTMVYIPVPSWVPAYLPKGPQ